MYCRNCGGEIDDRASFCIHCGVAVGVGHSFCQNCGNATAQDAQVCIHCGCTLGNSYQGHYDQTQYQSPYGVQQKSRTVAGILGILLGALGIHNFYLGYTTRGLVQLLVSVCTCGIGSVVMGIWGLVEGILILTGDRNTDARGIPLRD